MIIMSIKGVCSHIIKVHLVWLNNTGMKAAMMTKLIKAPDKLEIKEPFE